MLTLTEIASLSAAIVAIGGMILQWRRVRPERETSAVAALSQLLEDFNTLRDRLETSEDQETDCQERISELKQKLADCMSALAAASTRAEVAEASRPLIVAAGKLRALSDATRRVLDACRDGVVVSSPAEEGRFVFVNAAFARALGRTPDEIIVAGWRSLAHPEDVPAMEAVEANAWSNGGTTDNRYLHADGSWVRMRWHFTTYDDGAAFSIVWLDRRRATD